MISRQRQADGSIDVLYTRDYYSFGSVIEDNERNKGSYRFGYQGQYSEEDEKTNWHSFELRQYDSDIGRWLSIDPYGQYHSPYVAMGNAPNMMVDMDGGWSGGPIGSKISFVKNVVDWARVGKFALNYALPAAASVGRSYEGLNNLQQQKVVQNRGLFFKNEGEAYQFIWNNSFDNNANVVREVAGLITSNGILILPTEGVRINGIYAKNGPRISYNDYLPLKRDKQSGDMYVEFNGNLLKILGQIHSHPNLQPLGKYELKSDKTNHFIKSGIPVYIMRTDGVYNMNLDFLGDRLYFYNGTKTLIK